jgi:hypothetical protein
MEGLIMIDFARLVPSTHKIEVHASDNIFKELGYNTYDYKDLLSELIDNSIAAKRENELLKVNIYIC